MDQAKLPDLRPLFWPKSIAVVGASSSDDPTKIAAMPLRYIVESGYDGKVFPVNPRSKTIRGLKCYPSVLDIPDPIDVAIIMVPVEAVSNTMRQCVSKGVKAAVLLGAGFAEMGEKGKEREDEVVDICRKGGVLVCGPNTNGLGNALGKVPLGFSPAHAVVKPGRLGWIAQSGALTSSLVSRFVDKGIGVSYYVNAGNQADLEAFDYARYMLEDPNTDVVAMYLEGIKDPQKFLYAADLALQKKKPLVIVKVGRSELGAKTVMGHTASLAGSDQLFDAICRQKGITRADDFNDLATDSLVFLKCKLPKGDGVGIITTSGGAAALASDYAMMFGLRVPELTVATQEEAKTFLPGYPATGELRNLIDLSGAMIIEKLDLLSRTVNLFVQDKNIDIVLAIIHAMPKEDLENVTRAFVEASKTTDKPIVLLPPRGRMTGEPVEMIANSTIPEVSSNTEAFRAIAGMVRFNQAVKRYEETRKAPDQRVSVKVEEARKFLETSHRALTEHESKNLLSYYGIPIPKEALAKSPEEAREVATRIGYPVALKVDSPQILHKTDAHAIRLNLRNEAEMINAYHQVITNSKKYDPKAEIRGVLVQEMIEEGREVIVGLSRDPQFGPILVFGLGGVFVEVLKDVSMRPVPIARFDAEEMIREIRGHKVLDAFRGKPEADKEAIIDTLLKLSKLSTDLGDDISEIDINPLIVLEKGKGAKAADALIVLREDRRPKPSR